MVLAASSDSWRSLEAEAFSALLRDVGLEVIYTGRASTAPEIVQAAIQEDADAVGLTGDMHELVPEVRRLLQEEGAGHTAVRVFQPGGSAAQILGSIIDEEAAH